MSVADTACIAWDAYRLAIGVTPKRFTPEEIIRWLRQRAAEAATLRATQEGETDGTA